MKTPDEIKKGLEQCVKAESGETGCRGCPYIMSCVKEEDPDSITSDALDYIVQLESRLAQAERERDAAVRDLEELTTRVSSFHLDCDYCKDKEKPICNNCEWEWRGVCEENTKGVADNEKPSAEPR